MILLDTNIIVDAMDKTQPHHAWSKQQIEDAVVTEGGGISVVTLAELCAGARAPEDVELEVKHLENELARIRDSIKNRTDNREQIIKRHVAQLLHEEDDLEF